MCPDLPEELNRLKELDENSPYDPPYESGEGKPQHDAGNMPASGVDIDMTTTQEMRNPHLPPIENDDSPMGGVDRRGEAGEQGDDELRDFQTE